MRDLVDELQKALDGSPWHGPSLLQTLDGLTPEQASAHPVPGAHSIWELVAHLTSWLEEGTRRLQTGEAAEPEAGDWPEMNGAWAEAVSRLRQAHNDLLRSFATIPAERLAEPITDLREPPGEPSTYFATLHGLSQHYAYHAGQIVLLRRALERG